MTHLEDLTLGCVNVGDHIDGDYLSAIPLLTKCPSLLTLNLHALTYDMAMDAALAHYVAHTSVLEELNVVVPYAYRNARLTSPALIAAMRSNYTLKRVHFRASAYNEDPRDADFKAETETLTRLNRSGRVYMKSDAGNSRKALILLESASDSLDCIFFHLRENPLFCKRQHQQPSSPSACLKRKLCERDEERNSTMLLSTRPLLAFTSP